MTEIDTFLSTPPTLRFAFAVKVIVGPIQDLGQTARGHRRIVDILGGEAYGPKLTGEILRGGADWQIVRPDGTIEVVARYTIRSSTGALVYVQNDGLRVASPEIAARMSRGEAVPLANYRFRTAPRFETADASLKWLETSTFVGVAARTPDRVAIGFHEVL
ncbi:MAG: DUF3237 domain-containing protein [Alphaproteobacteria bacterium]|nr:DUF3237 domain-containing protein [Alphaproteobacteria bacterium]